MTYEDEPILINIKQTRIYPKMRNKIVSGVMELQA